MSDVSLRLTLTGAAQEIFVSSGFLQLPERGPWLARELVCSSFVAPAVGSAATLVCKRDDGSEDLFVGTVRRAVANAGDETLTMALVGGAGGLLQQLPPVDHVYAGQPFPAGLVARAICDACGEVLAPGVEQALDAILLPRWHRATDTSGAVALDLLTWQLSGAGAPTPGQVPYAWRVLGTGQVWIGPETFATAVNGAAFWSGLDPEDGVALYSVRGAPLVVGNLIDGIPAIEVFYTLTGSGLDARVRAAIAGDPPHVPDLDLYRGSYSATVVAQNADGTIDVRCDDARIGGLRRVAFHVGLPGALVTFDPTTTPPPRVRVRFDGASPAGAFAEGADQDAAAASPALRVADVPGLVFDPGVPATTPPALYLTRDGGASFVLVAMVTPGSTVGGTVPPPPSTPSSPLAPTGSARTKLR